MGCEQEIPTRSMNNTPLKKVKKMTFKEMIQSLNQNTDSKTSPVADIPNFYSPNTSPIMNRNRRQEFSDFSPFSKRYFKPSKFNTKKRKSRREEEEVKKPMGKFERAVSHFMKQRKKDEERDRARSFKIKRRKYEDNRRISIF